MMNYVDGFVLAVPSANKEAYQAFAKASLPMFRELGMIRMVECWGDDVPDGKQTDFRRAVNAGPDETVVFSWIEWPSKEVRDAASKAMMSDPRMRDTPMPFDGRRMIFGGFQPVLDSLGE